jgi:hypothetical protein
MSAAMKLPDTAMGAALAKADLIPSLPAERLLQLAIDAWGKYPRDASDRRQYVTDALRIEMTYSLVEQWDRSILGMAVGKLLNTADRTIKSQRPKQDTVQAVGGGQHTLDTQGEGAPATPSRDDVRPQADRRSEPASAALSPMKRMPAAPNTPWVAQEKIRTHEQQAALKVMSDKQTARMEARFQVETRLNRLDMVKIGDKSIGDCTAGEVRLWAAQRQSDMRSAGRDWRFAMVLTANLSSGAVIRHMWQNVYEIEEIYTRAEAEYAA